MLATTIIAVDALPERLEMAKRLGADHVVNIRDADSVGEILFLTKGRGVDVAIEALGTQATFGACLDALDVQRVALHQLKESLEAVAGVHQAEHHDRQSRYHQAKACIAHDDLLGSPFRYQNVQVAR